MSAHQISRLETHEWWDMHVGKPTGWHVTMFRSFELVKQGRDVLVDHALASSHISGLRGQQKHISNFAGQILEVQNMCMFIHNYEPIYSYMTPNFLFLKVDELVGIVQYFSSDPYANLFYTLRAPPPGGVARAIFTTFPMWIS